MLKRVLIANRGEIAVRIIRACREAGIETVAVYSKADANALHTQMATVAYCIGEVKASESYLNIYNILSVATATGCDAIHPGYGFLSESSEFARLCEKCNIKFIGPSASIIDKMGNKSAARELMIEAGVPIVPGSDGVIHDVQAAKDIANKIGYPVLLKASAGGGGRGIRKVFAESQLENMFNSAKSEAKACFGDDTMYMEKLIINPKHIEFQILGDAFGNIVHLGDRDCSL
ncbi:MAG: biotin carboxylase N-terminal domain-containing protein, partial [Oscillospiraceae bacterium]